MIKLIKIQFLLFICAAISFAQPNDLLEKIQKKYSSIENLSANFSRMNEGEVVFTGNIFYKKPSSVRLELKNITVVSDGKTNWNYNKKENKVIVSNYDEENPALISMDRILFEYPKQSEISSTKEGEIQILTLKPKDESGLNYSLIKLYINKENLIDNITVEKDDGEVIQIKLLDIEVNKKIPASKFSFSPPKGSKVIDLR